MHPEASARALQIPVSNVSKADDGNVELSYVVDCCVCLLVPQQRHRVAAFVVLVCLEVDLMQIFRPKKLVDSGIRVLVI